MGGTWIDVCDEAFVPPGTMRCLQVTDRTILIAYTSERQWFAADEMCTHEDALRGAARRTRQMSIAWELVRPSRWDCR